MDLGPDVVVGHRQDRGGDAERLLQRATDVGQPLAAPQPRGPRDVRRQVPIPEPEPRLLAVPAEHLRRRERLAVKAPALLLVREAGQRVHDGVVVGHHEQAVALEVVARC